MKKRMSMRQIAKQLDLSPATVSRIANGTGSFAPETEERVIALLKQEGYLVSEAAPKETVIGVLVPDFNNELFARELDAMCAFAHERDARLMVQGTGADPQREEAHLKHLQQTSVAGIVVISPRSENPAAQVAPTMPLVVLDTPARALVGEQTTAVASDNEVGGKMAAQRLLGAGCTRPVVIGNRRLPLGLNDRVVSFMREFEQAGHAVEEDRRFQMDGTSSSFDFTRDLMAYLAAKGTAFDSVFACNDWCAFGALTALQEAGVAVPKDVKVVGYDGTRISRYGEKPVTTVAQNPELMAQVACEKLFALIERGGGTHAASAGRGEVTLVPVRLQEGLTA